MHLQFPHQVTGTLFLGDPRAAHKLLGDEPGLGKTRQVIDALRDIGASNVLVICQAIGKLVWRDEFMRWDGTRTLEVVSTRAARCTAPVVIVNYDRISKGERALLRRLYRRKWDVIVLDEADALRNPASRRAQLILGDDCDLRQCLGARADRIWALTGTPAPKHYGELWTLLHALRPELIRAGGHAKRPMSHMEFLHKFCVVDRASDPRSPRILGSRNSALLKPALQAFMLRRRKKDVLKSLPALRFGLMPVEIDPDIVPEIVMADLALIESKLDALDIDEMGVLDRLASSAVWPTYRRLLGMIKGRIAHEIIAAELLGNTEKLIVFAHHRDVLDALYASTKALGLHPVLITGDTSTAQRHRAVDQFQNLATHRLFLGQTVAAGATITLTAASQVLFVEPSTVPRDNVQAASRAHRIGQKNGVFARYLCVADSLDEKIMKLIGRRTDELAQLFDDEAENLGAPVTTVNP